MNARSWGTWLCWAVLVLAGGSICLAADPEVSVTPPLARQVTDRAEFTGRTEATHVDVRARVTGYLEKIHFRDGGEVKQGDLLFEIDPRPYQAELIKAEALLAVSETHLQRLDAEVKRAKALLQAKAMSQEEWDKIVADRAEGEAAVAVARANRETARLILSFTKVTAPISGRIGHRLIDPGNLVRADETSLVTIVSDQPAWVAFDIDERTLLQLRRSKAKDLAQAEMPVQMGLADENGFPHQGRLAFADVRLDPDKGTLRLRAVFPNTDGLFLPGLSVRVRMSVGEPYQALLVPEDAVRMDKGQASVFVVGEKEVLEVRKLVLGSRLGRMVVVKEGLEKGDRVVVGKLRGLEPGTKVKPQEVTVPEPRD